VFVFEDDIDVTSYEQMDWAIAYRVNAGHGGIVISPGLLGHALDPSTPLEERDVEQLGAGIGDAFVRLRAYAYARDLRLTDVARDIVARRLRLHPDPSRDGEA